MRPELNSLEQSAITRVTESYGRRCYVAGLERGMALARAVTVWLSFNPPIDAVRLSNLLHAEAAKLDAEITEYRDLEASYTKHVEKLLGGC